MGKTMLHVIMSLLRSKMVNSGDSHIEKVNIAYIDAANLHRALKSSLGWKLDYARFRIWLSEKYNIRKAYLFIGLIPKYNDLYGYFKKCGYILIFKDVIYQKDGTPKGNCDADLIVKVMEDMYEGNLNKAIVVTSDGDYASLIKKLMECQKILAILSPNVAQHCSVLLKRTGAKISYLDDQRGILEEK